MFETQVFLFLMQQHGVTPGFAEVCFLYIPKLSSYSEVLRLVFDCDFQTLEVYFRSAYVPKPQAR